MPKASRALTDCYDALNLKGMSADLAQEIVLCARDDLSSAARKQPELVRAAVRRHLEARIRVRSRQPVPGTGPLVVFLLGQTGVGKSTTLVKMAGLQARAGRSVGLINADTVRAAAGFQLEDMARPLGVEVESLPNVAAFKEALARHADQAALFVDTPGYGHADRTHLAELAAMIESAPRRQVFLVLACNTPLAELREITRGFRPLGLDGLIFSKADETQAVGIALTLACETDVPVAYISTGRRVPDDLEVATPAQLSRLLWDDSDTPEISDYHMPWKTERMHFETCYESPEKRLL